MTSPTVAIRSVHSLVVVEAFRGTVACVDEIAGLRTRLLPRYLDDGSTYVVTRFVLLRLLGLVYLVAFASAFFQDVVGPAPSR